MTLRLATAFANKYHLYAYKRSGSIQIKEQYSFGANLAYLAPQGQFFMVTKLFIRAPLIAKKSSS